MTNQELYDYINEHIDPHLKIGNYIADEYVKEGYGQVRGGYFDVAYKNNIVILKETAEPSQKWHLIDSYYALKQKDGNFNMHTKANLSRIMCPQLMLWIAEIAGLNKELIKTAKELAVTYEKEQGTKDSRRIKRDVLKHALRWELITQIIKDTDSWESITKQAGNIK